MPKARGTGHHEGHQSLFESTEGRLLEDRGAERNGGLRAQREQRFKMAAPIEHFA